ncbi:MAG: rhomboid family intramembrane serine protease [Ferruginibacter sp.]
MSITIMIIAVTCIVSFISFSNRNMMDKLIFYPPAVTNDNEWYRFFSCGLLHKDFAHLGFNMYALYLFGEGQNKSGVEYQFIEMFQGTGRILYLIMYVAALGVCLIPTYIKHKNDYYYRSLGASGAVSAVVFASILFRPLGYMGLIFIPVYMVSFLFGFIYLAITYFLDKSGKGNINHSAHLWGSLFGMVFVFLCCRFIANYPILSIFVDEIKDLSLSNIIRTR